MRRRSMIISFLLIMVILSPIITESSAYTPWKMHGGDPGHTFRSEYVIDTSCRFLEKWSLDLVGVGFSVDSDGNSYVLSDKAVLYCIDITGRMIWSFDGRGNPVQRPPLIGDDGKIYFSTNNGYVFSIFPNGTLSWMQKFKLSTGFMSSPVMVDNCKVLVCLDNSTLVWFESSGEIEGYLNFGDITRVGDIAVDSRSNIICHFISGRLVSISPIGSINWEYHIGWDLNSLNIGSDDKVYTANHAGNITCLEPNGSIRYQEGNQHLSPYRIAIAENGTIYVMNVEYGHMENHGYLTCFGPSGSMKWKVRSSLTSAHPVIQDNGDIIVPGRTIGLFHPDGTQYWDISIPGTEWINSLVLLDSRHILILDEDEFRLLEGTDSEPPLNVKAKGTYDGVQVVRDPPSIGGIIGYNVYKMEYTGKASEVTYIGTTTECEYLYAEAQEKVDIFYFVRIVTEDGESAGSYLSCLNFVRSDHTPLNQIYGVFLDVRREGESRDIRIEVIVMGPYTYSPEIETLVLRRSTDEMNEQETIAILSPDVTYFIDKGLEGGHSYNYTVEVLYSDGSVELEGSRSIRIEKGLFNGFLNLPTKVWMIILAMVPIFLFCIIWIIVVIVKRDRSSGDGNGK